MAATFDPSSKSASFTLSNSDKTALINSGGSQVMVLGDDPITDNTYFEIYIDLYAGANRLSVGLTDKPPSNFNGGPGSKNPGGEYLANGSKKFNATSDVSYGSSYGTGDVVGVAYKYATGEVFFAKNNVWQASSDPETGANPAGTLSVSGVDIWPAISATSLNDGGTIRATIAEFSYAMPAGYQSYAGEGSPVIFAARPIMRPRQDRTRSNIIIKRL